MQEKQTLPLFLILMTNMGLAKCPKGAQIEEAND